MRAIFVLLVAVVAAVSAARVFPESIAQREPAFPWTQIHTPPSERELLSESRKIIVAIKQQNRDELERVFWERSNPNHENYAQYLTIDEITKIVKPTDEAISTVTEFLREYGATDIRLTRNMDFATAEVTLLDLQRMFDVQFSLFVHPRRSVIATLQRYSLPEEVAQHVDFVSHVTGLPDIHDAPRTPRPTPDADPLAITPTIICNRYNCTSWTASASNNSQAVAEFQAQYYSQADLTKFFQLFVPNAASGDDTVRNVVGTNDQSRPGIEASLDIQYIMGVAPGVPTDFYGTAEFNFYDDLTKWLEELSNETSVPWVHTVSYGSQGNYPSAEYMSRSDAEYQKLGVRGITIIYASGDSGAECEDQCKAFFPSYPAISVYVTSIGSTMFQSGTSGPEAATTAFGSGGGFSDFDVQPDYQADAVQAYLNSGVAFPPSNAFNASGRATPDFAALGDVHFQIIVHQQELSIGGTSASAPTFGAICSMLNDVRFNANKGSLGFVNPLFYQLAAQNSGAFYDVVVGDNDEGCVTGGCPGHNGFQTAPGWDAVSGYGTPNFEVLKTLV